MNDYVWHAQSSMGMTHSHLLHLLHLGQITHECQHQLQAPMLQQQYTGSTALYDRCYPQHAFPLAAGGQCKQWGHSANAHQLLQTALLLCPVCLRRA